MNDFVSICEKVIDELTGAISAQKDFASGIQLVSKASSNKISKNNQDICGDVILRINL